jgi:hypothetical protein
MGALKPALTGRLLSAVAVCFAIAIAMFMCGGVGSVAAEEIVIEVPTALATETNDTATGVYYGLTVVQWIVAAAGILTLIAFLLMKDFRILIVTAAMVAILVVMEYL